MGAKLVKGFELAKAEGGLKGQMRLAMKVGFSSDSASTEADSPEKIKKMETALKDVLGKSVQL